MARYAMVLDVRRCVGCHSCTVACRTHNDLPIDIIYNPVTTVGPTGIFPNLQMYNIPLLCMHCGNSPCVDACPTGASQQREDGIVFVDEEKCVGCKACYMACPYGARVYNKKKGVIQKCNFCKERIDEGKLPHCVQTCHQKARIFGDLEDSNSEVSKLVNGAHSVRLMGELGTEPYVFYIIETEAHTR